MYFKKLVGSKVYLSPIDKNDYLKYTQWLNDMEVAAGMALASKIINEESEKNALEELSKAEFNYAIIDCEEDVVIGNVGFVSLDYINHSGEVGVFIGDKNYWGNGYGAEALSLMLDFGFNILNLNSSFLKVFSYNTPAIKCYEKVGLKEAGRIREAKMIGGNRYDLVYMDILAREFKSPYIQAILDDKISGRSVAEWRMRKR